MEKIETRNTSYYKRLLILAGPIIVQQLISVGLNLVDNIMVGRLGALELAAVGSANQVFSIYSMILFGLFSGAAVPLAQYYGARDFKSIKKILGMDIVIGLSLALFTFLIVQLFAPQIIGLFADDEQVIGYGVQYIRIVAVTYLFVGVSFAISFNSRSVQILKVPTIVNACSILTNTILNYALIYGNFGLPALGVRGAAIATLIARFIELTALVTYLAVDKKHPFHGHLKEFTGFTGALLKKVMRTAMPVVLSEGGWSLGVSLVFAAYGKISAEALAVMQVSNVICSLCQCASFAIGNASAALTGETLGQREPELAYENTKKYMKIQWLLNGIMTVMILLLRRPIAAIYNFDPETTEMLMLSLGVFAFTLIPRMVAYAVQCGILRAGGDTLFCMVVELTCNLGIEVILAYVSVLVFQFPLHLCIAVASIGNLIKAIVEYRRYVSKKWINIVI
ncbi:MAG: MATE family efflux transporter [Anaerovoracaceae bacterium]